MNSIKHIYRQIGRETCISRLPSLFPFIIPDINGNGQLVKATEAIDGSYGKIMPNLFDVSFNNVWDSVPTEGLPYRQVMDVYYSMIKGQKEKQETFIKYIEDRIGLLEVDCGLDKNTCDLAPEYVFLAQVPGLYIEYKQMSDMCEFYQTLIDKGEDKDAVMCCFCEKFERMGGSEMLDWLKNNLTEAENRASTYFNEVSSFYDNTNSLTIPCFKIEINLTQSYNDMGAVVPAILQWKEKEVYPLWSHIIYNNDLYWAGDSSKADVNGYVAGSKWNDVKEVMEFNKDNFILCTTKEDTTYQSNVGIGSHISDSQLKGCRRGIDYINEIDEIEFPEDSEDWLFYYRQKQPVNIEYETDLFGNLINVNGELFDESNPPSKDNLMIIGNIIDEITADKTERTITFKYTIGARLQLTDVNYIISEKDDDGNTLFKLAANAKFERVNETGVEYEETYNYSDPQLVELIENQSLFQKYIAGEQDENLNYMAKYKFSSKNIPLKYKRYIGDMELDATAVKSTVTDYPDMRRPLTEIDTNSDGGPISFIRRDYHLGISYPDEVNNQVYIRRGTTTVFERHYKLSEIKTLTDMEEYANGGFFNVVDGSKDRREVENKKEID